LEIIQKNAWVSCPPHVVYDLVTDVEKYPSFLPWCGAAKILKHFEDGIEASLTVSKGGLSKNFTTRNIHVPHQRIEMHLLSGPFKHLEGVWTFEPEQGGTRVTLHLEFSFDSRLIAMMLNPLFQPVAHTLLEAFVKEVSNHEG